MIYLIKQIFIFRVVEQKQLNKLDLVFIVYLLNARENLPYDTVNLTLTKPIFFSSPNHNECNK